MVSGSLSKYGLRGNIFWMGLLPIGFVAYKAYVYGLGPHLFQLLWICNVCNLVLGVGIWCSNSSWVLVALLWIILGTPLWMMDEALRQSFSFHSLLTHLGSLFIGMLFLTLNKNQAPRSGCWRYAFLMFVLLQAFAHFWTPEELNINASNIAHGAMASYFPNYFYFWLLTLGTSFIGLRWVERGVRALIYTPSIISNSGE